MHINDPLTATKANTHTHADGQSVVSTNTYLLTYLLTTYLLTTHADGTLQHASALERARSRRLEQASIDVRR